MRKPEAVNRRRDASFDSNVWKRSIYQPKGSIPWARERRLRRKARKRIEELIGARSSDAKSEIVHLATRDFPRDLKARGLQEPLRQRYKRTGRYKQGLCALFKTIVVRSLARLIPS